VVRVDDGNAKRFMCTYHGWTYRNDGALDHVPGESEAYYGALDRPSLGLIEARVETYAGIVFATWAKDAPSLDAYLGDAPWYLDTVFNRRDGGMQALGPMKWLEPVNWKTMVDNWSDNYHVLTSHLASPRVQTRRYAAGGRRRARTAAGEGDHVAGRYEVARFPEGQLEIRSRPRAAFAASMTEAPAWPSWPNR